MSFDVFESFVPPYGARSMAHHCPQSRSPAGLICRRSKNPFLTRNAESRRYPEAGDAEQQIVAGVLVAKLVGSLSRDILHLISQIMLLGADVVQKRLSARFCP